MKVLVGLFFCMVFCTCESPKPEKVPNKNDRRNIVKTYDDSGKLHTQVTYLDGVKHGRSLLYYSGSDQVMLEMNYANGKRQGDATKYYENGKVYAITPYEDDEVNGVVKLYYRNGNIKAEIPYYQSNHGLGLKEYFTNGDLKAEMPEIIAKRQKIGNQYVYYFSIEDCEDAIFFIGGLLNNKYLIEKPPFVTVLPQKSGKGLYGFPKSMLGETINVICKCSTAAKNSLVTRKVLTL